MDWKRCGVVVVVIAGCLATIGCTSISGGKSKHKRSVVEIGEVDVDGDSRPDFTLRFQDLRSSTRSGGVRVIELNRSYYLSPADGIEVMAADRKVLALESGVVVGGEAYDESIWSREGAWLATFYFDVWSDRVEHLELGGTGEERLSHLYRTGSGRPFYVGIRSHMGGRTTYGWLLVKPVPIEGKLEVDFIVLDYTMNGSTGDSVVTGVQL